MKISRRKAWKGRWNGPSSYAESFNSSLSGEGERPTSPESIRAEIMLCSRGGRWDRNALLARRITRRPYPGMESPSPPPLAFVTRGERHCSTLSSATVASLISVVARDWALSESGGVGGGRLAAVESLFERRGRLARVTRGDAGMRARCQGDDNDVNVDDIR